MEVNGFMRLFRCVSEEKGEGVKSGGESPNHRIRFCR